MIKTIRTSKKLNLPELINHVWGNKLFPSSWRSEDSPSDGLTVQFFEDGMFRSYNGFHDYDTFTVEEEITEDTEFDTLIETYGKSSAVCYYYRSIKDVRHETTKKIYALIDGDLKLVWERGDNE